MPFGARALPYPLRREGRATAVSLRLNLQVCSASTGPFRGQSYFPSLSAPQAAGESLADRGLPHSHEAKLMSPLLHTAVLTSCCLTTHRGTLTRRQDCEDCMRGLGQVHVSPTMTVFPI